jgi:hypothetical protein
VPGELGIDILEQRLDGGRTIRLDLVDGLSDLLDRLLLELLVLLRAEEALRREVPDQTLQRIAADLGVDVVARAVA